MHSLLWVLVHQKSLELRGKDRPSRDCPTWGPSHNQPTNADTIAYASKILLKRPWYSCLLWGYASAWQIQKWMLTLINGEARESTQGAEGFCNPIGGTTIWTDQYPPELMSLAAYVAEDGLVGHHWEEAPWSCKFYMPQYRGMPGPRSGSG